MVGLFYYNIKTIITEDNTHVMAKNDQAIITVQYKETL